LYDNKVLELEDAEVAVQAIIKEASKSPGRPVAIAVADDKGDLIMLVRMTRTKQFFAYMATKKAHTSGVLGGDTRMLLGVYQREEFGKFETLSADMTLIPGGVAIIEPGKTAGPQAVAYGGIGISGRSADEDEALAFVGLKALQSSVWPLH
jgi:uncharacterized protein GlcG (DUF336 family)